MAVTNKGFIKDYQGNKLLPITRAELVLDSAGNIALTSALFEAGATRADGSVNNFGLISAAELALLKGGAGAGQGIADIYDKLSYINSALTVGNTELHFWDENGKTPIQVMGVDKQIAVVAVQNGIQIGLGETGNGELSASDIVKSITVDKYGRVTSVSGGPLTNAEIPNLDGKTISNSTLDSCKVSVKDISEADEDAVASKYYVDKKFQDVNTIATGALRFDGSLSTKAGAEAKLRKEFENCYYKVTGDFTLDASVLYDDSTADDYNGEIKKGDTLIVHNTASGYRFVHVPSGNDITTITIENGSTTQGNARMIGDVTLRFSEVFTVSMTGQHATINVPTVTANGTNGILSSADYAEFKNYAKGLKVDYTNTVAETVPGVYEIGQITIGENAKTLYGINNISALALVDGTSGATDPALQFTENGVSNKITIKGVGGIVATKNGDAVELKAANVVNDASKPYLKVTNGYMFDAIIGSRNGETLTEGLTKYSDFDTLNTTVASLVRATTMHSVLTGSLKTGASDAEGTSYAYGNEALVAAITITDI